MFERDVELVYAPSNMLFITAYAAKTCWQSHENLNKHQFDFIASLMASGHESVIEHGYCVVKLRKSQYSAKSLLKFMTLKPKTRINGDTIVANLVETDDFWFISINMRSIRTAIKFHDSEPSAITKALIAEIIPKLPSCYFIDLLPELKDNRFKYDQSYATYSREDRYAFLSDLMELDTILYQLIFVEKSLTVEQASELFKISFRLVLPRWESTQFNRHRIFSISAESLRYVKKTKGNFDYFRAPELMNKTVKVVHKVPNGYAEYPVTYPDLVNMVVVAAKQFEEQGVYAEDCRNLYPLSTLTESIYTSNIDGLNHLFDLRLHKHTQKDTRIMTYMIYDFIKNYGFHTLTALVPTSPYVDEILPVLYPVTR